MTRGRSTIVPAALLTLLVCAGCRESLEQRVAKLDPCALLTKEDIHTVLGQATGSAKREGAQCTWPAADGSNPLLVQLQLSAVAFVSYDRFAANYQKTHNEDPAKLAQRVDSPGGFALAMNGAPVIQVYSSSGMVQVATLSNGHGHALALARKAATRMQ
jgi:hypothetical protein